MNETGNNGGSVTVELPEPSLHAVNFDLEAARRYFIAQRLIDGAKTPLGHRWSNLNEMTQNLYFAKDPDQRERLRRSIARTSMEIRNLRRGQPARSLPAPPKMLTYQPED